MKLLSNFNNICEYTVTLADIGEYIAWLCTLAQSHRFALLLEPTGANVRASGVINNE